MANKLQQRIMAERKTRKNTQSKWLTIKTAYINREDEPSINQLAEEFGISQAQLGRKAKGDKWVLQRRDYWDKIGIKVLEKRSFQEAERILRNQKIVTGALSLLMEQIRNKTIKGSLADLDKLIRLDEFLHGNADSRPENVISTIERIILDNQNKRQKEHEEINAIEAELTELKPGQPSLPAPGEGENEDDEIVT